MNCKAFSCIWCSIFITLFSPATDTRATERFAIIVGHNLPDRPERPVLRYADDDAWRIYQLFVQAKVHAVLLCAPDSETLSQHPEIISFSTPRRDALFSAFGAIRSEMQKAVSAGRPADFYFFFSGHGDVEHGQGYLVLEDGRLSREEIIELLSLSPAQTNHIIIDACSSFYAVFGRGPGGERSPVARGFASALAAGLADRNGFLLSTAADSESHEWDRFRAGVFTYLLTSALRGAADANRDRKLSYAELGAYLENATASISEEALRPRFFIRPPGNFPGDLERVFLELPRKETLLLVDLDVGHVYLEDERGNRLLDLHPDPRDVVQLFLLPQRTLFLRSIVKKKEWKIPSGAERLSALTPKPIADTRQKGAHHRALLKLFAVPFSQQDVADYRSLFLRSARLAESLASFVPAEAQAAPASEKEPCLHEGARRCQEQKIEICERNRLGVLGWSPVSNCVEKGLICRIGECHRPGFGGKVVFVSDASGVNELWVMNDDGSSRRRLTHFAEKTLPRWGAYMPRWSPDGEQVAFFYGADDSLPEDPKFSRLCLIDQGGSGFREVTRRLSLEPDSLSWAGEEKLLVTTTGLTWDSRLLEISLADGSEKLILENSPDDYPNPNTPDISPRKPQLLLYRPYRCGQPDGGLRVRNLATGGEQVLVFPGGNHLGARWSLDGTRVGWYDNANPLLYQVSASGQPLNAVRPDEFSDDNWVVGFDWAEGGLLLAARAGPDEIWLWVCDADGKNARPILRGGTNGQLDWAPGRLPPYGEKACQAAGGHYDSDTQGGFGCWFAAREDQSCDQACLDHGLSCPAADWNDFPNSKICRLLTGDKMAGVNNPDHSSMSPYLYLPSGTSHGCYARAPKVRQDCSARSRDRLRLCLCRPFE